MLAMDVEQAVGQLAQLRHGGRAAIDPGAALALGVDHAAQQQGITFKLETGLIKPGFKMRGAIELGRDVSAQRTFANHTGVAAAAQRQLQRIDQNRFARAGLTGQHRKTGAEVQFQGGHDDEIAQAQSAQHAFTRLRASAACAARWRNSSSLRDAGNRPGGRSGAR